MLQGLENAIVIVFYLVVDIGIRIYALVYIPQNRRPSSAMAWIVAIFFVPLLGFLLYLLIGNTKLPKKRRQKQQTIDGLITERTNHQAMIGEENAPDESFMGVASLNASLGALPLVGGNNLDIIEDYKQQLSDMTKDINNAKNYVHAEFYIMSFDETTKPFFDSLVAANKRGVKVKVLLDHIGSMPYPGYKPLLELFRANNVNYQLMLPVKPLKGQYQRPDLRNHRKLLVVDGKVGFAGSINIIDSTYQKKSNIKRGLHWHDLVVRTTGPIVGSLEAVFIGDWYAETDEILKYSKPKVGEKYIDAGSHDCQLVPSGPGYEGENNLKLFNSLMYMAKNKIIITSPYFVPDESMLYAITTAAERGVKVELFVSEIGDQFFVYHAQRSYYEVLLKSGVKIFMYKSPTVLHAKHVTIDDTVAVVGSSNMDMRSFSLDLEISLLVYSDDFVNKMRKVESRYKKNCRELTYKEWMDRPRKHRLIDNVARLTSSLQ